MQCPPPGGLDSSFTASTASTRRNEDRDGGGQEEEEAASNHKEEEGGSYTDSSEEEGTVTIEGTGSSIRGSGWELFLSGQEGLGRRLFQLLHRRWHPSGRSRSHSLRPRGAARFSALLPLHRDWRSAGARVRTRRLHWQLTEREETPRGPRLGVGGEERGQKRAVS